MIPYGRQHIDEEDIKAVVEVLKSEFLTTGPKVPEFESAIAKYVGAKYGVAVNSGTSALDIAVAALGMKAGSEVITTPFTFAASTNCVLYNNLKPVFADIDEETCNISVDDIKKRITPKTKAIVFVDYAGQPCELDQLRELADQKDLFLIEDACHALGAEYKEKKIGGSGHADLTIFSFHPVKHITTGEGGMVMTKDEGLLEKMKLLRTHGIDKSPTERTGYSYDMKILGRNYRITDIQCALGLSQLKRLDLFLKRRREIAAIYDKELPSQIPQVRIPKVHPHVKHARHLYPILLDKSLDRDKIFASMRSKGIGVNVHYIPTYKFTHYRQTFGFKDSDYPNTESIFKSILSIPIYYGMSEDDARTVIRCLKESIAGK